MAGHILCLYIWTCSSDWGYLEVCIMISWGSLLQIFLEKNYYYCLLPCVYALWDEKNLPVAVCSWLHTQQKSGGNIWMHTHRMNVAINFLDDQKTIFFFVCIKCFKWLLSFLLCIVLWCWTWKYFFF